MQAAKISPEEERLRLADSLAESIVELSSKVLSKKRNPKYIALKVGDGPYSNVVTVRWQEDTVSFHIPSSDLEEQAIAEGFNPENQHARRPFFRHKR